MNTSHNLQVNDRLVQLKFDREPTKLSLVVRLYLANKHEFYINYMHAFKALIHFVTDGGKIPLDIPAESEVNPKLHTSILGSYTTSAMAKVILDISFPARRYDIAYLIHITNAIIQIQINLLGYSNESF